MTKTVEQVSPRVWAGDGGRPSFVVPLGVADIEKRLSITFEPAEDDLGDTREATVLASNEVLMLVFRSASPTPGTVVYLDGRMRNDQRAQAIATLVAELGIEASDLPWVSPEDEDLLESVVAGTAPSQKNRGTSDQAEGRVGRRKTGPATLVVFQGKTSANAWLVRKIGNEVSAVPAGTLESEGVDSLQWSAKRAKALHAGLSWHGNSPGNRTDEENAARVLVQRGTPASRLSRRLKKRAKRKAVDQI